MPEYPSEAINYGVSKASGEILAFIDMSTLRAQLVKDYRVFKKW